VLGQGSVVSLAEHRARVERIQRAHQPSLGPLYCARSYEEDYFELIDWTDSYEWQGQIYPRGDHWGLVFSMTMHPNNQDVWYVYGSTDTEIFEEYERDERPVPGVIIPANWCVT
jgi:hypothetical protein